MSLEAARNLSVLDLLHVLNEKLGLECDKMRETVPPAMSSSLLEKEITSLEARAHNVLRIIPSLWNFTKPVNRLPPAILCRIARHIPDPFVQDASSIIPLTHVCRYWRESIVSAPENWTLITSQSKDLAALSLERAKAAPLNLCLDMDEVRKQRGLTDVLTPHIQNAETLEFSELITFVDLTRTLPNFPQSMPSLRLLEMSLSSHAPNWDPTVDPFKSFPSSLRYLFLCRIPLYPSFLNLSTLVEFSLYDYGFSCPLDTLLMVLEQNHFLKCVSLGIGFRQPALRSSQRQSPTINKLQLLSVTCEEAEDARAIISNIPLRRGADLKIISRDEGAGLDSILSDIPATHFINLSSPTRMISEERRIRLSGPNGSFWFQGPSSKTTFAEVPLLSFDTVRELRLGDPTSRAFGPSLFPALESLAIERGVSVPNTLSTLLSSPTSSPALKTLAFLNCYLPKDFMEDLVRFASNRKNTMLAWLHRVVIVDSGGRFPSADSIRALGKHVPVVDVRFGTELPTDLI